MATTDRTTIESPCLCGKGKIAVTCSQPDHGFARLSQIDYTAKIACEPCGERYEIRDGRYNAYPWVVKRTDADRQREAADKLAALESAVMGSDATLRLRHRIVAEVDGQPSMAAAHRVLRRFGLAYETVSTYRKRPYGGEEATRHIGAAAIVRIGSLADMGTSDTLAFEAWAADLELLEDEVRRLEPAPVETGAVWLRV